MATWQELIAEGIGELTCAEVPSPEVDAREIAEYVSRVRRPIGNVSEEEKDFFFSLIKRRCSREPLQHLTGRMYFRYLELVSRPGTFIVRPETELVAESAIKEAKKCLERGDKPVIVDLCTGSGAIAIALATEVPGSVVIGVEKSEEAYLTAEENNRIYGEKVHLVRGDALEFEGVEKLAEAGKIDVIASNPPYVPAHHKIAPEVEADPAEALWGGGADGLDIPCALVKRAAYLLRPGGLLVMEHSHEQGAALRDFAASQGFVCCTTGRDYSGRDRWLCARRELPLE